MLLIKKTYLHPTYDIYISERVHVTVFQSIKSFKKWGKNGKEQQRGPRYWNTEFS